MPLPHLLMRSVTSAMLYRITQNDNHLAELIGKEVLEPYLYRIILRSGLFDEVYPEQEYIFHRNKNRSLDVLARKESHYIFLTVKCTLQGGISGFLISMHLTWRLTG